MYMHILLYKLKKKRNKQKKKIMAYFVSSYGVLHTQYSFSFLLEPRFDIKPGGVVEDLWLCFLTREFDLLPA